MKLEAAGRPTVVIATERFESMAARAASGYGLSDARIAVVPHPIGGTPDAVLRRFASRAVDGVLDLFTAAQDRRGESGEP